MLQQRLSRCADATRTVVGTVASASYREALDHLVATASRAAAVKCVALQAMDNLTAAHHPDGGPSRLRLVVLPGPAHSTMMPEKHWCVTSTNRTIRVTRRRKIGWRRSHFYRVLMWRNVLSLGFNLLAVDCDWSFRSNPMPSIAGMQPAADVIAYWDGPHQKMLNVGLIWMRATPQMVALVTRVQNRTWAGWEQAIFSEELNWGSDASCCHCTACLALHFAKNFSTHGQQKSVSAVRRRFYLEGSPDCSDTLPPPALPPPATSGFGWGGTVAAKAWRPIGWNSLVERHYGRCTGFDARCTGTWQVRAADGTTQSTCGCRRGAAAAT